MKDLEKAAAKLHFLTQDTEVERQSSAGRDEAEFVKQRTRKLPDDPNAEKKQRVGVQDRTAAKSTASQATFVEDIGSLTDRSEVSVSSIPNTDGSSDLEHLTSQSFEYRQLSIPLKKLEESGHVTPSVTKNKLTEEYRRIKRPLIRNLHESDIPSNRNVLMVTSAVSGEGKTFTSINLAMSLVQERQGNVIFVDADVLKGSAGQQMGVARDSPGLIDVLIGTAEDVREVVQQTNVPNLWFIPAGKANSHTNELLASDDMERCIGDISQLFEDSILVFDCPPILLTNEANVLLHHAGQIIFVVAERQTSQRYVNEALEQIEESKYLGVIFNRSKNRQAVYSYGY